MKIDFRMELRAFNIDDAWKAREWRNSWQIWAWTRQNDLISEIEQEAWYKRQAHDPSIRMYGIWVTANQASQLVGVAGLTSLDWQNRRAEFSLYVGPDHHRRGYGRQALRLLLDHAFRNLGLHQVWGETFDGNPAMKIFTETGFRVDGRRRDFYWKDGRFIDAHLISILAGEWDARNADSRDSGVICQRGPDSISDPSRQTGPKRVARRLRAAAAVVETSSEPAACGAPSQSTL